MKRRFSLAIAASGMNLSICTVALALAQLSYAQDASSQSATDTSAPAAGQSHHRHHSHQPLDQRLNTLKAALQIQPNQEGAWQAYASAAQTAATDRKTLWQQDKQSSQSLTLPQRIDRREAMFRQMLTDRQAVDNALKQLYASLTAQQQAVLEQHVARHHRGAGNG